MEEFSELKSARLLSIYARLLNGRVLKKTDLAQEFGVTARSIQRDLESLRSFLSNEMLPQDVVYDRAAGGYRLTHAKPMGLSNSEILAVCKILLESRSMRRDEMLPILDKLVDCCVPEENKRAVQQRQVLELDYQRLRGAETVRRTVEPVGILFSEYYFYLAAYLRGVDRKQSFENPEDPYPTIYRIDRIRAFRATGEHFTPAYAKRFQEGEFRRRVQFMYGGKLQKIRFKYTGPSIEAVLDRLPTAEILSQDDSGWLVSAEVFGKGIEMWIKSQGEYIETE
jgi:predicted DNA-binding transcriptional regulator YafY